MIPIIPVIIINYLGSSNNPLYNNQTTFRMVVNINMLNTINGEQNPSGPGSIQVTYTTSGYVYFEGKCWLNNASSYLFEVNLMGYSVDYYRESEKLYSSYGSEDNLSFQFDNTISYLNIYSGATYRYDGQMYVGLRTGGQDIVAYGQVNNDYIENYVYDIADFESFAISNDWIIDFENDSTWLDYLEDAINKSVTGSDANTQVYYDTGYRTGYQDGERDGERTGMTRGREEGYAEGLIDGFNEGFDADSTAYTVFNGILSIGMIPINFFLACFNFDILGINMTSFVTALLSVSMVVIIFRFLFNGKSGD